MSTSAEAVVRAESSLVRSMAEHYGLEPSKFYTTVVATLFPVGQDKKPPTPEQVAMFLIVANKYNLNPFIKEIYAFPAKSGGIIPVVSIDGWITTVQRHPQYDGHDFEELYDGEGKLSAVKCIMYRKDRGRPITMTEYLSECKRNTDPWNQMPNRMLHHKAFIQTARYAFGLGGIYDEDEAERIQAVDGAVEERRPLVSQPQRISQAQPAPQRQLHEAQPQQVVITNKVIESMAPDPVEAKKGAPAKTQERTMEPLPTDEVLTPKERETVIQAGFATGWQLSELKAYLYKHFNVQAIGDLKRSQLQQVVNEIKSGGRP